MELNIENYHLKSSSFFEYLTVEEALEVRSRMTRKEFSKGESIFVEGSYSKGIYIVRKGKVKIFQTNADGKQSIVYIYRKGDFFGYRPLLCEEPQPVSAVAMDTVVLSFISKQTFMAILNSSPSLARKLLVDLSREFTVWINKMNIYSQYPVKKRVALALLICNRIYKRDGRDSKKVSIAIGRDDFAGFVGTAKETLVRMLRNFKDEGIIVSKGTKIFILKPKVLINMLTDL